MAEEVTVKVSGLADLERALNELAVDLRKKVLRGALRDGAKVIVQAARALAPVLKTRSARRTPGLLKRRITVVNSKIFKGTTGELGVYVTVRTLKAKQVRAFKRQSAFEGRHAKASDNPNDPFYAGFVERGTKHMAAHPFLRPAGEASFSRVIEVVSQRISERIQEANRRK